MNKRKHSRTLEEVQAGKVLYGSLAIGDTENAGEGLYTTVPIPKNAEVIEYMGQLMTKHQAEIEADNGFGFWFKWNGKSYVIDGSCTDHKSRFINHSKHGNLTPKVLGEKFPHIYFFANRDIAEGEELRFNYGDTRAEVVKNCPWLKK